MILKDDEQQVYKGGIGFEEGVWSFEYPAGPSASKNLQFFSSQGGRSIGLGRDQVGVDTPIMHS